MDVLWLLSPLVATVVLYQVFSPEALLRPVPRLIRFLERKGWLTYDDSVHYGDPWW